MVIDQWDVVLTNVTHIDRLKGANAGADLPEDSVAGIHEVFGSGADGNGKGKRAASGSGFRLDWLSPFTRVCFPSHVEDQIMGFCRPCLRVVGNDYVGLGGSAEKVKEEDYEMTRRNVGNTAEIV